MWSSLDYSRFKLFLLSVLLRAHWSRHQMYKDFDIGAHEKRIKYMVLNHEPGSEKEYAIAMAYIKLKPVFSKFISPIIRVNSTTWNGCIMNVGGMCYLLNFNQKNMLGLFNNGRLKTDGSIEVAILEGDLAANFLKNFLSI